MEENLQELFQNKTLKFIFVGGKGGVGKTTTSSSIALELSKTRGKTLIISTDPAHNLSDAFNQQFTHEPTQVKNTENLFALEIDPKKSFQISDVFEEQQLLEENNFNFLNEIITQVPGIDEAIVFMDLIKMSKNMNAEVVLFDTAPTGHTLKMLNFPQIMEKGLGKLMEFQEKINSMLSFLGPNASDKVNKMFDKMKDLKKSTEELKVVLQNPDLTTFVTVCIPEFLSVYETERLVQELAVQNIDIFNIVVNQIVFFDENENCKKCRARFKMQNKYIKQIKELYDDFHIVFQPLEDEEIRGIEKLNNYAQNLKKVKQLPTLQLIDQQCLVLQIITKLDYFWYLPGYLHIFLGQYFFLIEVCSYQAMYAFQWV